MAQVRGLLPHVGAQEKPRLQSDPTLADGVSWGSEPVCRRSGVSIFFFVTIRLKYIKINLKEKRKLKQLLVKLVVFY